MLEREIERKLTARIKALGGLCLKFESPGYTGVPDRLILLPGGRMAFVELKQSGKRERPRQRIVQKRLRELGFRVYETVDSVEKINVIVEECREVINGGADL